MRTTAGHFGRVLRQLWLEVTGFVFLALAFIGAVAIVREFARYQAGQTTTARVVVAIVFTLTFVWFGVNIVLASMEERLTRQSSVFGRQS